MSQTKERIEYLDLAKGFCIILVVIYHLSRYYDLTLPAANFLKAFRMPLYFFLSGVFFKTYEGFFSFAKRKTNKLLIPFVFWYIIGSVGISLVMYHAFGIVMERVEEFSFWRSMGEFFYKEDFPNSPIWFLLCLFEVNLLFYIVVIVANRFNKYQTWLISCLSVLLGIIGVGFGCFHINLPMYLDSSLSSLPFFVFGYIVYHHTSIINQNKFDKYNWFIIILLFGLVYLFAGNYSLKYNTFSLRGALSIYPCGMMGVIAVILLSKEIGTIPVISFWGRFSIMILVSHRLVYQALAPFVELFNLGPWLSLCLNLILTFMSYFFLIPFMRKYMPYVTAQKDVIRV